MTLKSKPDDESYFIKYATTLYNEVPKSKQETENLWAVVPKLKRYFLDKTLARSPSNLKKGGPECDVWKEKCIVTLMSNVAFGFINCVCFRAQSPGEDIFFLCK